MKTYSWMLEKGGDGKTSLTAHLAAGLAIAGHRVVVLDGDGQASLTETFGLKASPGVYDLLVRGAEFDDVLLRVPPETYAPAGAVTSGELLLVPANAELHNIANNLPNVYEIKERLEELDDWADFVVMDTPPSPSLFHAAIYAATDYLLCPCKCEAMSIAKLKQTLLHMNQSAGTRSGATLPPVELLGIVPTHYRGMTALHAANLEALREEYGDLVWTEIAQRVTWGEASQMRQTLFAYDPNSDAAKDAQTVVNHVIETAKA